MLRPACVNLEHWILPDKFVWRYRVIICNYFTLCAKTFSADQPCQRWTENQRFTHLLRLILRLNVSILSTLCDISSSIMLFTSWTNILITGLLISLRCRWSIRWSLLFYIRISPKSVKLKHSLVLTGMLRLKPVDQHVLRYHSIVSCALNMEKLISKKCL
jgi:hypothetical protein